MGLKFNPISGNLELVSSGGSSAVSVSSDVPAVLATLTFTLTSLPPDSGQVTFDIVRTADSVNMASDLVLDFDTMANAAAFATYIGTQISHPGAVSVLGWAPDGDNMVVTLPYAATNAAEYHLSITANTAIDINTDPVTFTVSDTSPRAEVPSAVVITSEVGNYNFIADPDTAQANIFVGVSFGAGLISGANGISGEYGADLMLYGGQSPDTRGGNIILSAGYNQATNTQANVYVGGTIVEMQGVLRMQQYTTTERDAISSPQNGWVIINSTLGKMQFYFSSAWHTITSV
jgi:hypothetical protein